MMKKLTAILLVVLAALTTAGCGNALTDVLQGGGFSGTESQESQESRESQESGDEVETTQPEESLPPLKDWKQSSESSQFEFSFPSRSDSEGEQDDDAQTAELSTDGLTIIMPKNFRVANELLPAGSNCLFLITNLRQTVGVTGLKDAKSYFAGTVVTNIDDYLKARQEVCTATDKSGILTEKGVKYFEYSASTESGDTAKYFCTAKQSADDYWILMFFCMSDEYAERKDDFVQWSQTATVS